MNTLKELTKAVAEYIDTLEFPEEPAGLYEPMRYSLEGGGKRLRPMLQQVRKFIPVTFVLRPTK